MTVVATTFRVTVSTQPSWIPTSGQVKTISANTISDVATPNVAPYNVLYSGSVQGGDSVTNSFDQARSVYNKYYGAYGARMHWGGGHSGWRGNEVWILPITGESSTWVRMTNPYPASGAFVDPVARTGRLPYDDVTKFDKVTNEFLVNGSAGQYFGFSPATDHTRNKTLVMPGGTQNKGRFLVPLTAAYPGTGYESQTSHWFDCGMEDITNISYNQAKQWWTRGPTFPLAYGQGDFFWLDEVNNRVGGVMWATFSTPQIRAYYLDYNSASPAWRLGGTTSAFINVATDNSGGFCADRQLLALTRVASSTNTGVLVHWIDLSTVNTTTPPTNLPSVAMTRTGTNPAAPTGQSPGMGLEYCPVDGYWYSLAAYSGLSPAVQFWRLKPADAGASLKTMTTAEAMAATWQWEDLTSRLPGIVAGFGGVHRAYNELQWSSALQCFVHHHGANNPVQLINPVGM